MVLREREFGFNLGSYGSVADAPIYRYSKADTYMAKTRSPL